METITQIIDIQRRAELAGHAAVLLRLNNVPIRSNSPGELIRQATLGGHLVLSDELSQDVGIANA